MRRMTLGTAIFLNVVWLGSAVWAASVKPVFYHEAQSASTRFDVPRALKQVPPPPPRPRGCTAPGNDDCANATPILSVPFTDTVNTACATDEAGEPPSSCTFAANSVWYTYVNTATNPQEVTVDTFLSDFDTTLQILTGPCGGQTPIACNDDIVGSLQAMVTFVADPGVIYSIQIAGFGGSTGTVVLNVTASEGKCSLFTLDGTLGSAASTGLQTGRLNRNEIASTCATLKSCDILKPDGTRPFDSYSIPNLSGADQCLRVHLEVPDNQGGTGACNLQSNAYLNTYDPANICTNYLADPGSSTGGDPNNPTDFSFVLPANNTAVIVVHSIDPDLNTGCNYSVTAFSSACGTSAAEVSLAKTLTTAGAIHVGDNISFALALSNNGPGSATGVTVTDTLPAGLTYVSNDCGAVFASPTLTWTLGALAVSASTTCNLTATVNQPGTITNVATATANESDPVSANNSSTSAVTAQLRVIEVPALGPGGLLALLVLLGGVGLAAVRRRVPKT